MEKEIVRYADAENRIVVEQSTMNTEAAYHRLCEQYGFSEIEVLTENENIAYSLRANGLFIDTVCCEDSIGNIDLCLLHKKGKEVFALQYKESRFHIIGIAKAIPNDGILIITITAPSQSQPDKEALEHIEQFLNGDIFDATVQFEDGACYGYDGFFSTEDALCAALEDFPEFRYTWEEICEMNATKLFNRSRGIPHA